MATVNTRTPRAAEARDLETREQEARDPVTFVPSSFLPTPAPMDGYAFRWIRTSYFGASDTKNVSAKFREGWIPVKRDDHPELEITPDRDTRFPQNVEIGGLLLCKAPIERVAARRRYYAQRAANQIESVDNQLLRENDPRMPLLKPQRKSRTTFGSGGE